MNFIAVEPMAVASDLADYMVNRKLSKEEIYIDDPDNPNQTIYSEEAQNIFNDYYDDFIDIVNRNKIDKEIR